MLGSYIFYMKSECTNCRKQWQSVAAAETFLKVKRIFAMEAGDLLDLVKNNFRQHFFVLRRGKRKNKKIPYSTVKYCRGRDIIHITRGSTPVVLMD